MAILLKSTVTATRHIFAVGDTVSFIHYGETKEMKIDRIGENGGILFMGRYWRHPENVTLVLPAPENVTLVLPAEAGEPIEYKGIAIVKDGEKFAFQHYGVLRTCDSIAEARETIDKWDSPVIARPRPFAVGELVSCPPDRGEPEYTGRVEQVGVDIRENIRGAEYVWISVRGLNSGRVSVWPSNRLSRV